VSDEVMVDVAMAMPRTRAAEVLAAEMLAAVQAGDAETMLSCMTQALGLSRHQTVRQQDQRPPVVIYKWFCPWCDPQGPMNPGGVVGRVGGPDGEKCRDCLGRGVLTEDEIRDPSAFGAGELREVPRPPAVMRSPCVDCAYKPGSPESPEGVSYRPDAAVPFFCHHGMVRVGDGYEAPAYVGTMPLGAMVCAGWWALATGGALPTAPFRDPGGADRPESAPEVP
jgi:hypothetical protein